MKMGEVVSQMCARIGRNMADVVDVAQSGPTPNIWYVLFNDGTWAQITINAPRETLN